MSFLSATVGFSAKKRTAKLMLGFPKCVNARGYCNRSRLETRYAIQNSSTEKAVYRGGHSAADLVVGCATVVVFVTTTTRLRFDRRSTAIRLLYDHSTTCVTTV